MGKPIKKTPTLKGRDAVRFLREVKENEDKKVSKETVAVGKKIYDRVMERTK